MSGQLAPLVLLPRFTTYTGASTFYTIAMDVTAYSGAILNIWRGKLIGTTPTIAFSLQESTDQLNWTACAGTNVTNYDPTQEMEGQATAQFTKQWFRIKVVLGGTDPSGTCWAIGFLEQRVS